MVSYRFRVKAAWKPRELWRDVVIGVNRSLQDLQQAINLSFGLDFDHLWFFGTDEKYWNSHVKYLCPWEFENPEPIWILDFFPRIEKRKYNASKIALADLNLAVKDRLCYLFDYGDEWRFYMILKEQIGDDPSDKQPIVAKSKGKKVIQYLLPEEDY